MITFASRCLKIAGNGRVKMKYLLLVCSIILSFSNQSFAKGKKRGGDDSYTFQSQNVKKALEKSLQDITKYTQECKFSFNSILLLSMAPEKNQKEFIDKVVNAGKGYSYILNNKRLKLRYRFDADTGTNCTLLEDVAKNDPNMTYIHYDTFMYSPGALMAVSEIKKAMKDMKNRDITIDGILFQHVNANGERILNHNDSCNYSPKKNGSNDPKDWDWYMTIDIDLGNYRTGLEDKQDIIKECINFQL